MGYFRAVPSQNGDKIVTPPPPPLIVERVRWMDVPPHGTLPRLWAHCLTTSDRRTSCRAVYRVFWHTSLLTKLGGPERLYHAIGHIGTRLFYETPGAIVLTAASCWYGKAPSRDNMY